MQTKCSKCGVIGDLSAWHHICNPAEVAKEQALKTQNETQEQLIRRVIREEIQLAFPERYAAKL